jgi:hypothetical protein
MFSGAMKKPGVASSHKQMIENDKVFLKMILQRSTRSKYALANDIRDHFWGLTRDFLIPLERCGVACHPHITRSNHPRLTTNSTCWGESGVAAVLLSQRYFGVILSSSPNSACWQALCMLVPHICITSCHSISCQTHAIKPLF